MGSAFTAFFHWRDGTTAVDNPVPEYCPHHLKVREDACAYTRSQFRWTLGPNAIFFTLFVLVNSLDSWIQIVIYLGVCVVVDLIWEFIQSWNERKKRLHWIQTKEILNKLTNPTERVEHILSMHLDPVEIPVDRKTAEQLVHTVFSADKSASVEENVISMKNVFITVGGGESNRLLNQSNEGVKAKEKEKEKTKHKEKQISMASRTGYTSGTSSESDE